MEAEHCMTTSVLLLAPTPLPTRGLGTAEATLAPSLPCCTVQAGHQGLKLSTLSEMSQQLMATAEKSGLLVSSAKAGRKKNRF